MSIISDAEAQDIVGAAASDTLVPMLRPLVEKVIQDRIGWKVEQDEYTRYYPTGARGAVPERFPGRFGVVPMNGSRLQVIRLHHKFVLVSGLQVWESAAAYYGQATAFGDGNLLTVGSHYVLDTEEATVSESGHLRRLSRFWPRQPGSVQVTYTAGFTAEELAGTGGTTDASDIRFAVHMLFQKAYREMTSWKKSSTTGAAGPIESETVPGYSYKLNSAATAAALGFAKLIPTSVDELIHKYRRYDL